jgi:hypothetical protein
VSTDEQAWHEKFSASDAISRGELFVKYDKPAGVLVATPDTWHGHNALLTQVDIYGRPIIDDWHDDVRPEVVTPTEGKKFLLHAATGIGDGGVGGALASPVLLRYPESGACS